MKRFLLAATSFLAIAASHSAADAAPIVFDFIYTVSLVTFMVTTTDTNQILAFRAQGSRAQGLGSLGGLDAEIGSDFSPTAGETLQIGVGGAGGAQGGGGGASFVIGPDDVPLVIAGGGGGGGSGT